MSLKRIAEILCVDEVKINHGPKGVAVHVLINDTWHSAAIDNDVLVKGGGPPTTKSEKWHRLERIAEHLAFLADANIPAVRDLHKSQADAATRAAAWAESENLRYRERKLDRLLSWDDVGGFGNPRYGATQQQLTKAEPLAPAVPLPAAAVPDGPAAETMPSRFHAIMAELRCL